MVMPLAGTFDYVAIVPESADDGSFECAVQSREPVAIVGDKLKDSRLVGLTPTLTVAEAGITPEADTGRPWVMRSRLTLTATSQEQATVAEACFHVDRALARRMQPGDILYLGRTNCGGLALSVVRRGELVVAVGAVTSVSLGHRVSAKLPDDLIGDATKIFRRRDNAFAFVELPIEVVVDGASKIAGGSPSPGGGELGGYQIIVTRGYIPGVPGTDECAAIWHNDLCSSVAARASAELIDSHTPGSMAMVSW